MDKRIEACKKIEADMRSDAEQLDGRPFDGRTVGENFGYCYSAIAALARILAELIEERDG